MTILVTGGAGFIGTNFIRNWFQGADEQIVNIDALTYAGNPSNLADLDEHSYHFRHASILDTATCQSIFEQYAPRAVVHFAAESHVDRSILAAEEFVQTNVVGTFRLLETARHYWEALTPDEARNFRFVHVSTDEVFGSLEDDAPAFSETTSYAPNSPYAASKAGSDHLARSFHETYGLPVIVTNCSNNYGPYQFPEKLIPLMISNAVLGKTLPVYGDGRNVRDWLYVTDHCDALTQVLAAGRPGETYNVGGRCELPNNEVVTQICAILDEHHPDPAIGDRQQLIRYVEDRKGHDRRYAVNCDKLEQELGWAPRESFETGLRKTVEWYLANPAWVENVTSGKYRDWIETNYADRAAI